MASTETVTYQQQPFYQTKRQMAKDLACALSTRSSTPHEEQLASFTTLHFEGLDPSTESYDFKAPLPSRRVLMALDSDFLLRSLEFSFLKVDPLDPLVSQIALSF